MTLVTRASVALLVALALALGGFSACLSVQPPSVRGQWRPIRPPYRLWYRERGAAERSRNRLTWLDTSQGDRFRARSEGKACSQGRSFAAR